MGLSDAQIAKAIAYGGIGVGALFPAVSLYNSGQENRGAINTTAHLAGAGVVGGAIGVAGIAGGTAYATNKILGKMATNLADNSDEIAKTLVKIL